jgi:hypothetical protein
MQVGTQQRTCNLQQDASDPNLGILLLLCRQLKLSGSDRLDLTLWKANLADRWDRWDY